MSETFRQGICLTVVFLLGLAGGACGGGQAAPPALPPNGPATATIAPASVTLQPGQTQSFSAVLSASAATAAWNANGGTVSGQGLTAAYIAGNVAGQFTVTVSGGGASATAKVTIAAAPVAPKPTLSVSPGSAQVAVGAAQAFTAQLSDGSNPGAVTWSVSGGGSVSRGGVFTAASAGTFTLTAQDAAGASASAALTVTAAPPPPPATSPGARLFPGSAANWLYSAPTGAGLNISGAVGGLGIGVNAHDGGFDYPVQYTDGTHGCTNFTDTLQYAFTDHICVPLPAGGLFPSVGGWGANDGHLVIVDTATGTYYDFWKLYVDAQGQPTSTNVGGIVSGSLNGNGTPGTTAANITGLAGDILAGELDCATCLNHALSVVVPGSMNSDQVGQQAPASKTDGSTAGAIFREGAKLRFDPGVDISGLPASVAVKAIMRALQLYGGVITDQTGGNGIGIYSALASKPDETGIQLILQHLWIYY